MHVVTFVCRIVAHIVFRLFGPAAYAEIDDKVHVLLIVDVRLVFNGFYKYVVDVVVDVGVAPVKCVGVEFLLEERCVSFDPPACAAVAVVP